MVMYGWMEGWMLRSMTFHALQQLIMMDRQRQFDYLNENENLKVFTIPINETAMNMRSDQVHHDVTP